MKYKIKKTIQNKGFTIIELIVAMSLFIILMTISVGGFISALRNQRSVNNLMAVNNNAGLVLEQMVREIRTGYRFCAADICNGVEDPLIFINHREEIVIYELVGNVVKRNGEALTASNVLVETLGFLVIQGSDKCNPWRVTIRLKVSSTEARIADAATDIQMTISSRVFPGEAPGVSADIFRDCRRT